MFTVAFIGFGNSVVRYHLPYLRRRKNINVKTIYRRTIDCEPERKRESLYPDIYFTNELEDITKDKEIDLVSINVPNEFHYKYAKILLEANKNILVEKPFMKSKEAKEIFALAKKKGLFACANQNRRYDPDFLSLKEALYSNKLGDIIQVESHYDYFKNLPSVHDHVIRDIGIHLIDQVVSLFGLPSKVDYDIRKTIERNKADDFFDIKLYYEKFTCRIKTSLFVKSQYPRFIVHGKKGSFIKYSQGHLYNLESQEPFLVKLESESKENWGSLNYIDELGNDCHERIKSFPCDYGRVYEDIIQCIFNNQEKIIKDEEVIEVLEFMEKIPSPFGEVI